MSPENAGAFRQTFSFDNCTGRFLSGDPERDHPLFGAARRFSCVFLSASTKDAVKLNHHLSAAGVRAYHASDTREAETLLAITNAKVLVVDIDRTFEPWAEILQKLDDSYPNMPKVVLTARDEDIWSPILSHFALDVVPKPVHLGDLLAALGYAHTVEQELNDPERIRVREARVLKAIRSGSEARPVRRSIRQLLSVMMERVIHVWWKSGGHRARKQHSRS